MVYSYSWIKEYINALTPQRLKETLNLYAFEVEGVKKSKGDWLFDIDVLPNRAHDALNHYGMAREIAAILKLKLKKIETKEIKVEKGDIKPLKLNILAKKYVPRYSAIVIQGVRVGESPKWLKDRLNVLGINSINNVVDITNYVMLEMGQPLHVFDYDEIKSQSMRLREANKGEKIVTLDEGSYELPKGALIIEDTKRIIDLAGIKGGKVSGATKLTKNIVFQAATFDPAKIYETKKQIGITTPASDLYAYGIDPNLTIDALKRAIAILGQGKVVQLIDIYPKKITEKTIRLNIAKVQSVLGVDITEKEIKGILGRLDFKTVSSKKGEVLVTVPTRRIDVAIPEDIIEEIGRIYGYEKIKAVFPVSSLFPPQENEYISWKAVAQNAMREAGLTELYNYSFIGVKDLDIFRYTKREKDLLVELENPISSEYEYMRSSLIENMLKSTAQNSKENDTVKIFEVGNVFYKEGGDYKEKAMLCGVITGDAFYEVKGVVDFLCERMGIKDVWYDNYKQTPNHSTTETWQKNKSAEIKIRSEEIGYVGVISSKITSQLKIQKGVAAFQIDFDLLRSLATKERAYIPASKFPPAFRDISILVPREVQIVEVMNIMNSAGGELVADIDVFDIYEGKELGDDKKSLAFHVMYQSDSRTLLNTQVDKLHKKIINALKENPEWEVRE